MITRLQDVKKALGPLSDYVRDISENQGVAYIRLEFIKDKEEWKTVNREMLERLGPGAEYKNGFYTVKLQQPEAAKPSLSDFPSGEKKSEVEIKFVDGKGEPLKIPEKNVEVYAGREVKTGLPKIDEKHAAKNEAEELAAGEIVLVEIRKINPNKYNPNEMSDEEFNALLDNMRKEGAHGTDPLLVRPLPDSKLEIIDGYHRWKAAGLLGWKKIRCIVREVDEDRAQEINYAKNKLRGHINPFKEAELFFHTWEKVKRLEDIGKKFSVSISYVSETVSLRKIPDEVQKIIPRGINRSLLEILARLEDPSDQEALAMEIAAGITVRGAEDFVKNLKRAEEPSSNIPESKPPTTTPIPTAIPSAVSTAIPSTPIVKKGPYWCPCCLRDKDDMQLASY